MEQYYSCCGKYICGGCIYSITKSENDDYCPFCKAEISGITEKFEELMKRVEANDAGATCLLGSYYSHGNVGLQQDLVKGVKLWTQAAELGSMSKAHFFLGKHYYEGGNLKKAKFHYEAAAMAGHDVARCNLGCIESESGNIEQAMKHWAIAASAGYHTAMVNLIVAFRRGHISRETIDSTLAAYNNVWREKK
jgi:TPR repeat protein